MKPAAILTACLLAAPVLAMPAPLAVGETPTYARLAAAVPYAEPARLAFPPPAERTVLPCLAAGRNGYHVLAPDAQGAWRVAFLPYRNAWGHLTATAAEHDGSLPAHTLRIETPVPLRPGRWEIPAGTRVRVLQQGDGTTQVAYEVGGGALAFATPSANLAVEAPPAPVTDPVLLRLQSLQTQYFALTNANAALVQRVEAARTDSQRLVELLSAIAQTDAQNRLLVQDAEQAEALRDQLIARDASDAGRIVDVSDAAETARRRGVAEAERARLVLDVAPLRVLSARLARDEADILRFQDQAREANAELAALASRWTDPVTLAHDRTIRTQADAAAGTLQIAAADVRVAEGEALRLVDWSARLEGLQADRKTLTDRLAKLETDIAAAREALRAALGTPAE